MNKPLVSIIIPVFNRAHLIGETLDSIMVQTYENWECIIVDDGSTDATFKVTENYCKKDSRFKLYKRPENKKKGGNAARNYGFKKSSGEFVNWFDSDDLMEETFIEDKLNEFLKDPSIDFVVSKSINFFENGKIEDFGFYNNNLDFELNADNFIQEKIHWLTPDIIFRKSKIGDVYFDENLFSGQEYNYIIKTLVNESLIGLYFDKMLSNIRTHDNSIQELQKLNILIACENKYITALKTFDEVYLSINKASRVFLINQILKLTNPLLLAKKHPPSYLKFLYLYFKECGILKLCFLVVHSILVLLGKNSYKLRKMITAK